MKRILLALLAAAMLTSLTVGQEACPEQPFCDTTGLDPNQILTDPVTGRPCLFQDRMYAWAGKPITLMIRVCDDDLADPNAPPQTLRLWREPEGEEVPIEDGEGRVVVQYDAEGWHYVGFALTDGIDVRMGSIAIHTQPNKPPALGGCRMLQ